MRRFVSKFYEEILIKFYYYYYYYYHYYYCYYYYYYQQRVLDVEMGSFTPLIFGTNGGMVVECQMVLRHLAEELSKKDGEPYAAVITWLRTRLSFEILRSVHLCVRVSRKPFRSANEVVNDFRLKSSQSMVQHQTNCNRIFFNLI